MKALLTIILNSYLFVLGLSWIFVHFYFRFLIERSSFYFHEIKHNYSWYHMLIFSLFIILHLIVICSSVLEITRKKNKQITLPDFISNISKKLSDFINIIYWKPLQFIHDLVAPIIPGSARFFVYLINQWQKKDRGKYFLLSLTIIFDVIPKIIIAISFFIDIVIYGQIKYFLYCLGLITIPIFFSIFVTLFISCSTRNSPIIRSYFENIEGVDPIYNDLGQVVDYSGYNYLVKDEYLSVIDAEEEIQLLISLDYMRRCGSQIKDDTKELGIPLILFTSTLYFFAGVIRFFLCFIL